MPQITAVSIYAPRRQTGKKSVDIRFHTNLPRGICFNTDFAAAHIFAAADIFRRASVLPHLLLTSYKFQNICVYTAKKSRAVGEEEVKKRNLSNGKIPFHTFFVRQWRGAPSFFICAPAEMYSR